MVPVWLQMANILLNLYNFYLKRFLIGAVERGVDPLRNLPLPTARFEIIRIKLR